PVPAHGAPCRRFIDVEAPRNLVHVQALTDATDKILALDFDPQLVPARVGAGLCVPAARHEPALAVLAAAHHVATRSNALNAASRNCSAVTSSSRDSSRKSFASLFLARISACSL